MDFIRAYLLTLTSSVMVGAWVISPMTASPWPLVLLAILGLIVVARLEQISRKGSSKPLSDTGSGSGKTKR